MNLDYVIGQDKFVANEKFLKSLVRTYELWDTNKAPISITEGDWLPRVIESLKHYHDTEIILSLDFKYVKKKDKHTAIQMGKFRNVFISMETSLETTKAQFDAVITKEAVYAAGKQGFNVMVRIFTPTEALAWEMLEVMDTQSEFSVNYDYGMSIRECLFSSFKSFEQ